MCDLCLLVELHAEWVEPVVRMIRLDALLYSISLEETEACVMAVRISRSPYYVPLRVRRTIMESMLIRRSS